MTIAVSAPCPAPAVRGLPTAIVAFPMVAARERPMPPTGPCGGLERWAHSKSSTHSWEPKMAFANSHQLEPQLEPHFKCQSSFNCIVGWLQCRAIISYSIDDYGPCHRLRVRYAPVTNKWPEFYDG